MVKITLMHTDDEDAFDIAVDRLADQATMAQIALHAPDTDVCKAAVGRITDPKTLENVLNTANF